MHHKIIKLAFLIFSAVLAATFFLEESKSESASSSSLHVMTFNIGGQVEGSEEPRLDAFLQAFQHSSPPDVVFLQECNKNQANRLASQLEIGHCIHARELGHLASVAILSKYPLNRPVFLPFQGGNKGHGFIMACIATEWGNVLVGSVHLDRIEEVLNREKMPSISWAKSLRILQREYFGETIRCKQTHEIISWLRKASCNYIILGGDFNTVPFSRPIRKIERELDDALWPSLAFFRPTYRKLAWPVQPRIDYIFHSGSIECIEGGVVQAGPSDHYPVWACLQMDRIE